LGHLFGRPEPREVFADLIEGLLSDLGRKNGWTMAGRAGHATPHRIQKFLGEASWSAAALLTEVQAYVARPSSAAGATTAWSRSSTTSYVRRSARRRAATWSRRPE
jgi:hypothetical protein